MHCRGELQLKMRRYIEFISSVLHWQLEISGKSVNMISGLVDSANVGSCGHDLTDTNEIESVSPYAFFTLKLLQHFHYRYLSRARAKCTQRKRQHHAGPATEDIAA